MIRRVLLAATFVTAFSAAGFGLTSTAEAWRGWGRPYGGYYAPRAVYYGPVVPHRAYYYRPRIVRPYYYTSYYAQPAAYPVYPDYFYYAPGGGISVSVGF